jgi:hypothetical protein
LREFLADGPQRDPIPTELLAEQILMELQESIKPMFAHLVDKLHSRIEESIIYLTFGGLKAAP